MNEKDPEHRDEEGAAAPSAWEALAEVSSDMLALVDAAGAILWVNPAFERISGHARDAAKGQPIASLLGTERDAKSWDELTGEFKEGATVERRELSWRHASGDARSGLLSVRRIAGLPGPAAMAVSLQDVSEQHRLEELLETAQEFGRLGVWERRIPSGEGRWDRHVFRFFGMEASSGTPDFETAAQRIHPDDRHQVLYPESVRRAGRYEARYRVLLPDGTVQRIHSQWEVKASPQGVPERTVGIMVDDTGTYELAQAFNETSEQLRLAVDLGNIAIWRQNLRTNRMHYNYRAYDVLGIAPRAEGLSLEEVRAMIHPDDLPRVIEAAAAARNSDVPVDMEARYRRPDGSYRHVLTRRVLRRDAAGEPMEFVGVALDVTERIRTEEALRGANERVALAARAVGMGIWEWDPVTGESRWDEQMFRLRGREPTGHAPDAKARQEMAHAEDSGRVERLLAEAVAHQRSAAYEFRVIWPDGSVHWLASRSTPVRHSEGDGLRYVGVNWDITDSVTAEAERRERLVAQRESEAKSQFLARMSHELRTPLNAVLGFAQLLQLDSENATSEQRARIEHILSAGEHLLSLINDVLDLSSLESGQLKLDMQPVPLSELVDESLPLVTPLADGMRVSLVRGPVDGVAWGDRIRLRQVLLNLLSNAIKYNRPGGTAELRATAGEEHVVISVADTGRGLSPEQRLHLFEPFNRLGIEREGIEGTGIGLAIVKTLVGRMGGTIDVESEPGKGSTFAVKLQRADVPESAEAAPAPDAAEQAEPLDRARLLYIEDNPINVMLMEEIISSRPGLAIVSEPTGERGVARARKMRPDLVLVDMQLPDFDGFEVLRRLRAAPETAGIPCLAVSANAMPEDIARALEAGFAEYWTKPVNFGAFVQAVEARLRERLASTGR